MARNQGSLHQGQATERDVKSASARVGFDDLSGTVSGFMQVLFPAAGGWNFFYTPKEGDQVVVGRLPNGAEEGYILGKVYTAGKMPQGGEPNIILLVSDDGKNLFRFNADNGTLDLFVDQDAVLKFKNLDIEVKELTKLKTQNLDVEVEELTKLKTKNLDIETEEHANSKSNTYHLEVAQTIREEAGGNINRTSGANITETAAGAHTNTGATVNHN